MLDSHMSYVCSLCIYDLKQPTQISQEKLAEMGAIVVVLCVFCCLYTLLSFECAFCLWLCLLCFMFLLCPYWYLIWICWSLWWFFTKVCSFWVMASRCGLGGLPLLRDGFPKHPYPAVETKTWCKEKVFIGVRTSYTFLVSQVLGLFVDWQSWVYGNVHLLSLSFRFSCRQNVLHFYTYTVNCCWCLFVNDCAHNISCFVYHGWILATSREKVVSV